MSTRNAIGALAIALAAGPAVAADRNLAIMTVRAEVRPSATFRLELRAARLTITDADVARGYVELPAGPLVSVSAGRLRPAITLEIAPADGPLKPVDVKSTAPGAPGAARASAGEAPAAAPSYRLTFPDKALRGHDRPPLTLRVEL